MVYSIELVDRNLKLIFKSYARSGAKPHTTFEDSINQFQTWTVNTFVRFCKDFNIPYSLKQQLKAFNSNYQSRLDYSQF